jgi:hypothetical protein
LRRTVAFGALLAAPPINQRIERGRSTIASLGAVMGPNVPELGGADVMVSARMTLSNRVYA